MTGVQTCALPICSAARTAKANGMMMTEEGADREDGEVDGAGDGVPSPCVRTLEGHSKSVTSLYYEDGCLVSSSASSGCCGFVRSRYHVQPLT